MDIRPHYNEPQNRLKGNSSVRECISVRESIYPWKKELGAFLLTTLIANTNIWESPISIEIIYQNLKRHRTHAFTCKPNVNKSVIRHFTNRVNTTVTALELQGCLTRFYIVLKSHFTNASNKKKTDLFE